MDYNFIISTERSGSNLVTKMMDSHSNICGPAPKHLIRFIALNHYKYGDLNEENNWNIFLKDILKILDDVFSLWKSDFNIEMLSNFSKDRDLFSLIKSIFTLEAENNNKVSLFIKENNILDYFPMIDSCFPDSKFLFLVRDPRDTCLSYRNNPGHPGGLVNAAYNWKLDQNKTIKDFLPLFKSKRAILVKYEDLLINTKDELKRICRFIKYPFDPKMLEFHKSSLTIANSHKQHAWKNLNKKVMNNNHGKFRDKLSQKEVSIIEKIVTPCLMSYLGYKSLSKKSILAKITEKNIEDLRQIEKKKYPRVYRQGSKYAFEIIEESLNNYWN